MEEEFTTNKRKILSRNFVLIIVAILIVLSLFVNITFMVTRAVFGLLFVLFVPGFIATYAFFKNNEIDLIERIALSIGLSISLVVLTVMFTNLYLRIPINLVNILIQISSVCGFFLVIVYLQKLRVFPKFTSKFGIMAETSKKKMFIMTGVGIVILLLAVDIMYPFIKFPVENPPSQNVINRDYSFEKLYNSSMTIYDYYPQKNIAKNLTKVTIPMPFLEVFDDKIALLGYDMDKSEVNVGDKVHFTYFWKNLNVTNDSYSVLVHFTDVNGNPLFKQDHPLPLTSQWKKGDIIMEEYDFRIPLNVKEGTYFLRVGLNDTDGKNVPVVYGQFIDTQNRAIIGRINVKPVEPLKISDYYDNSMLVHEFYPQNKTSKNITGITIQYPFVENFNDKILFLGYNINSTVLRKNETFHITYFWKSLDKVDINYTVFVHFTNKTNTVFSQDHKLPIPTSLWKPDDIIMEEYDVKISSKVENNIYDIRIGLYDQLGTGKKLPIVSGYSFDKENRAIIGQVSVIR